ncbi:MAG: flippase-like domain-containing protein [Saprospiraceae bacterium]|nr:flippase-like domain-containing protein [Saprospiraceae bacterium]
MTKVYSESEKRKALSTFRLSRVFLPVLIGLTVVGYLFYHQYDPQAFANIQWTRHTLAWILLALGCLLARIFCYAWRLYILADQSFSFAKCIQLIFLWEFSSAVSPTNVGGSTVALFIIAQEKIGVARTTTIVLYTIVLDALFSLICIPVWVIIFGGNILGPGRLPFNQFGGWEITLLVAYGIMFCYGAFFAYGLFYKPQTLRRFSIWLSRRSFLSKYRDRLVKLGDDIAMTSRTLYRQDRSYHISAFVATAGAWSCRFFLIICLIAGICGTVKFDLASIFELYARIQTMFVMMAVSPTPGGAGFAEILFGELLADYVPSGISFVVASLWRMMAYYFFLLAGAIIIPQWLNGILRKRKREREQRKKMSSSGEA